MGRSLIQEGAIARNRKWGAVFMICPQATYDNNTILHDVIQRKQVFTPEHWIKGGRTLKELISRIMLTVPEHKKVRNVHVQSLIIFDDVHDEITDGSLVVSECVCTLRASWGSVMVVMVVVMHAPCNGRNGKTMRAGLNNVFALTDEVVEMVVDYTEVELVGSTEHGTDSSLDVGCSANDLGDGPHPVADWVDDLLIQIQTGTVGLVDDELALKWSTRESVDRKIRRASDLENRSIERFDEHVGKVVLADVNATDYNSVLLIINKFVPAPWSHGSASERFEETGFDRIPAIVISALECLLPSQPKPGYKSKPRDDETTLVVNEELIKFSEREHCYLAVVALGCVLARFPFDKCDGKWGNLFWEAWKAIYFSLAVIREHKLAVVRPPFWLVQVWDYENKFEPTDGAVLYLGMDPLVASLGQIAKTWAPRASGLAFNFPDYDPTVANSCIPSLKNQLEHYNLDTAGTFARPIPPHSVLPVNMIRIIAEGTWSGTANKFKDCWANYTAKFVAHMLSQAHNKKLFVLACTISKHSILKGSNLAVEAQLDEVNSTFNGLIMYKVLHPGSFWYADTKKFRAEDVRKARDDSIANVKNAVRISREVAQLLQECAKPRNDRSESEQAHLTATMKAFGLQ